MLSQVHRWIDHQKHLHQIKGTKIVKPEKINIAEKIDIAVNSFQKVIQDNHGVKETNILALLLPIGISSHDLDIAWLATMNTFGKNRGVVAHQSATRHRTQQLPDPETELKTVTQITQELLKLDELINNLQKRNLK